MLDFHHLKYFKIKIIIHSFHPSITDKHKFSFIYVKYIYLLIIINCGNKTGNLILPPRLLNEKEIVSQLREFKL